MQCDPADQWKIDYSAILPYVDIFLPNEKELLILARKRNIDEALTVFKDFVNILAVKLGDKGSVVAHGGTVTYKPAYTVDNVVDAIGAGDSFDAGFIYKFLHNATIETCQAFGNLVGAISTTASGGTTAFDHVTNIIQYAREKFGYTETRYT
jgi:sugar/nucleoside kinase (ribokinase family)